MDIIWHGNSCFSIKTKTATAVINPYTKEASNGLMLPPLKGTMVMVTGSKEGNDNIKAVSEDPKVIDWPGEYEVSSVVLTCKEAESGKGFFITMVGDNIRICYLEDVGEGLNENLVEEIGDVDILILPVGGIDQRGPEIAHKITETIEPRCVIPMDYSIEGSTGEQQSVDAFLKLAGITPQEPEEKFSISSRSSLSEDKMDCVLLTPKLA